MDECLFENWLNLVIGIQYIHMKVGLKKSEKKKRKQERKEQLCKCSYNMHVERIGEQRKDLALNEAHIRTYIHTKEKVTESVGIPELNSPIEFYPFNHLSLARSRQLLHY